MKKNPPNETSFIEQLIRKNQSKDYIIEEPYKTKGFIIEGDVRNIEAYNEQLRTISKIQRKRF